jgi:hypothetical protein
MAEWLFNNLVPVLLVLVVIIYVTAWRTLAPRSKVDQLRDCVKFGPETQTDYYDQVANCDPYNDHRWVPAPTKGYDIPPGTQLGFNGTCAADFSLPQNFGGMSTGLHDKEFVIPHRDTYPHERVKTVDEYDQDIETVDTFVSYTELMGRLRTGTLLPADMPPTLPVTFEMLLSLVMSMIDTNERKGDATTCDKVFALLRRRYDATSLNSVPEARYLELWVDLKGLNRG